MDRTTGAVLSSVGIQNLVQAFVLSDGLVVTVNDALQSDVYDLDSGERSFPELRSGDEEPFPAAVIFPEADGFWAVSHPGHVLARWENGELVDALFLGSGADVLNDDHYPAAAGSGSTWQ